MPFNVPYVELMVPEEMILNDPQGAILFIAQSMWSQVPGIAISACPLCASLVWDSYQDRMVHATDHVNIARATRGLP